MVTLVITSGSRAEERIDVDAEVTIGREGTDVQIDDSEISRRHVRLRPLPTGLEIEDLGSSNGTRVNGKSIETAITVSENATLEIGETTLRVEIRAAVTQLRATPVSSETRPTARNGEHVVTQPDPEPDRERTQPRTSPPARRAPAPAADVSTQEFGAFRAAPRRGRRQVATRLWVPMVMTYAAVAGTAAALIAYFAQR